MTHQPYHPYRQISPGRSSKDSLDPVLLPERSWLGDFGSHPGGSEQVGLEEMPSLPPISHRLEDDGLEPAYGVILAEQVVPDFGRVDHGGSRIGEELGIHLAKVGLGGGWAVTNSGKCWFKSPRAPRIFRYHGPGLRE